MFSINKEGKVSKPFLLPQKNPMNYYDKLLYSYNVPEFTNSPVKIEPRKLEREIVSNKRVQVEVRK
jgi:hypothetical protein